MSDCLPDEVVSEILLWLPVKSLIRFRCVSKTWCFLICHPHFITAHLNHSYSNPQRPPYLLLAYLNNGRKIGRLTLPSFDDPFRRHKFTEWRITHQTINQLGYIAGSCDGLLCFARDYHTLPNRDSYVLWNPSIQKAIALPNPNVGIKAHRYLISFIGFGYVRETHDYKLVRIAYYSNFRPGGPTPCLVQVYTLRTHTWRTVMDPGPPYLFQVCFTLASLNGAVHWPATVPQQHPGALRNVIVSFDLEDETFREVGMPKSLQWADNGNIVVVNGMLALASRKSMVEDSISAWVMKEYGVVESWTKLFDINNVKSLAWVRGSGENGEVLLEKDGELFSYEPSSQRTVCLPFRGMFLPKYVESLVLLNVEDGVLTQPNWLARNGAILRNVFDKLNSSSFYCFCCILMFAYFYDVFFNFENKESKLGH